MSFLLAAGHLYKRRDRFVKVNATPLTFQSKCNRVPGLP